MKYYWIYFFYTFKIFHHKNIFKNCLLILNFFTDSLIPLLTTGAQFHTWLVSTSLPPFSLFSIRLWLLLYSTPLKLLSSKGPRTSACLTQAAISVFISLNLLAILTCSWFLVFSCVTYFSYFCWLLCLQCHSNCWNAMGLPVDTSWQEGPLQYHSFKPNLNADDIQLGTNLYVWLHNNVKQVVILKLMSVQ